MIRIKCLIVDDEPLSQEVVKQFVNDTPGLIMDNICSNAIDALEYLKEHPIDLIFLDVNMPKLSGLNFAKLLEKPPMIVFTTAYPEFAVEGFELEAVDYLVKPIPFERFLKAANKAISLYKLTHNSENLSDLVEPGSDNSYLTIKADKKIYRLELSSISYFESIGDYVKIHTPEKVIVASHTLKTLETKLNTSFVRIHKSYIVSLLHISYVEGNMVRIGEKFIPVGLKYKDAFIDRFRNIDSV